MKKITVIMLSILLLFSCVYPSFELLNGKANAENSGETNEEYFENISNWSLNTYNGTNIGSYSGAVHPNDSWQKVTLNTDANYTNNSATSVKIAARNTLAAIMLPNLKKGYKYTVSFDYFTTGDLINNAALALSGIFAPEVENANVNWGGNGFLVYKGSTTAYTTENGVFANKVNSSDRTSNGAQKNKWCNITLEFYSADFEKLALILQPHNGVNNVYVDNIKLIETQYFEDTDNWSLNTYNGTNIGSYDGAVHTSDSWQKVTLTADANYTNNSECALKIDSRNTLAAIMLPNVKKGYKYKVSFDYFTTGDLINNAAFALTGIFAPEVENANINWGGNGFLVYEGSTTAYTTKNGVFANKANSTNRTSNGAQKNKWCNITLEFNSADFEKLALILQPHNGANSVYVDNIKLIEIEYFEDTDNWSLNENTGTNIGSYEGAVHPDATSWKQITLNTDVNYTNNSDASVKIAARNTVAAIMLPSVKKGYKYKVSFDYLTTGDLTNNSAFAMCGIFAPKVTNANINWGGNGYLVYKAPSTAYTTTDGLFANKVNLSENASEGAVSGQWCSMTLEFNSGDFETLALALMPHNGANAVYVDNIKVVGFDYYEDIDNWSLNTNAGTNIGSYEGAVHPDATNWQKVTSNTDEAYTNNSESSVKIAARNTVAAIMLPNIKKDYNYKVTFDYFTTGDLTNNSAFAMCGIFAPETTNANINWGGNGYLVYKAPATAYTTTDGIFANKVNISENASEGAKKGEWCSMTLEFNSGDFETLALALMPHNGANLVYVDNIKVVGFDYYEDIYNWSLNTSAGTNIGSYEGAVHPDATNWQKITLNTDANYTNNSDSSVKISSRNTVAAIMLPNIQKGHKYIVTFDYLTTGDLTNNSAFAMCGIFAPEVENPNINWGGNGYLLYKGSTTAYTTPNGIFANKVGIPEKASEGAKKGEWCSMTLEFNSGDFENLALALMPHNGANLVYVDNISLNAIEIPTLDENGNRVIDMEQPNVISSVYRQYIHQVSEGGYGDNGASLYLPAHKYENGKSVTALNWDAICSQRNESYFKTIVESDTAYRIKVRVKSGSSIEANGELLLYADYYGFTDYGIGTAKLAVPYSELKVGQWQTYTFNITTAKEQTEMAFYFIAGTEYPELYIDEVEISKMKPKYDGPKDEIIIDFDDDPADYSHIVNNKIKLDKTIGINGEETTALHIIEYADEKFVTFPSYATVSEMNDRIFTIPVEENTLYKFSMWMKVDNTEKDYNPTDALILYTDYKDKISSTLSLRQIIQYTDIIGTDWTEYTVEFVTKAGQNSVTFAFNADNHHPSIWMDNISYSKIPAGFKEETTLNYCEDYYNLIKKAGNKATAVIIEKVVIKLDVNGNTPYTYGLNLSGNGTLTFAFDESGNDVIKTLNANNKGNRVGGVIVTGKEHQNLYLIFEPSGSGIEYKAFYLFRKYSRALSKEMGYEENINNKQSLSYENIPTVNGDNFDFEELDENSQTDNSDFGTSPSTGDSTKPQIIFAILVSALFIFLLTKNRKNCKAIEKN